MQRRKFVIGMGALASGAAATIGTGAFTSVTATRDIDVEVADDASAYLRLKGADSHYVVDDGTDGTLEIDLSGDNPTSAGGSGVNPNAVTEFGDLFEIANQGTQTVTVEATKMGPHPGAVTFEDGSGTSLTDGIELDPGESATISLSVDTTDSSIGANEQLVDSVVFHAVA